MAIHLKAARVNAGLSLKEAAKELGIGLRTLVNYEQYKTIPSIELAKKMARLYHLTVDDIIFFAE